jgi:amidase
MVPIAHGNDGGGSTRIPAACCGLVGLKPARGRVSAGPDAGDSFLVQDGVLTRTVAETAQVLDLLAGYEPGDSTWAPEPDVPYSERLEEDPGRLLIGIATNPPLHGAEVDPVCEKAARDAADLLASLGHDIDELEPPWSNVELLSDFTRAFGPMTAMATVIGGRIRGREPTEADVEPLTWTIYEHAREHDSLGFLTALGRLQAYARTIVTYLEPFDLILTPALAQRPVAIGEVHGLGPEPWEHYRRSGHFTPFTAIGNVTGLPAIALPLYHGDDGLPTSVQLIGRPAREDVLLSVAAQLEGALPWAERLPELAVAT